VVLEGRRLAAGSWSARVDFAPKEGVVDVRGVLDLRGIRDAVASWAREATMSRILRRSTPRGTVREPTIMGGPAG
jgi:hypothetical protein